MSEDEPGPQQPRFSIAIDEENSDVDSFCDAPPRLSTLVDECESTSRSVERPRRALSEQFPGRLSRGNLRESDRISNISNLALNEDPRQPDDDGFVEYPFTMYEIDKLALSLARFKLLMYCSDNASDVQLAISEHREAQSRHSGIVGRELEYNANTLSPFPLIIPNIKSMISTPERPSPAQRNTDRSILDSFNIGVQDAELKEIPKSRPRSTRVSKNSRHGVFCPVLPAANTKAVASRFLTSLGGRRSSVGKNVLQAIVDAGDEFFAQLGKDLEAFASHAGRKKIDESDVITVLKRSVVQLSNHHDL